MVSMMNYSWVFLIFMSLLTIFVSILLRQSEIDLVLNINVSSFGPMPIGLELHLDSWSLYFASAVFMVSGSVFWYSKHYMPVYNYNYFIMTLLFFVLSMLALSFSGSLFMALLGWDGLGITSLCLIMFFKSWSSFKSSAVTFLSNRFGDVFFMISMIFLIGMSEPAGFVLSLALILSAMTKSAQLPFSSWLPLAMAAPTPVSSLVHSSTLVTAGIYLMIRFNGILSPAALDAASLIFSLTLLYSGVMALTENDLKKIVAYSTLSHISFIMMSVSIGLLEAAMFHLLTHACFKSLLFMVSGVLIHINCDSQDIRFLNLQFSEFPVLSGLALTSVMSMVGVPALSGYFSKEFILLEGVGDVKSMVVTGAMLMGIFMTSSYSARLICFLNLEKTLLPVAPGPVGWGVYRPMIIMFMYSNLLGLGIISSMHGAATSTHLFWYDSGLKLLVLALLVSGAMSGLMAVKLQSMKLLSIKEWGLYSLVMSIPDLMLLVKNLIHMISYLGWLESIVMIMTKISTKMGKVTPSINSMSSIYSSIKVGAVMTLLLIFFMSI